MPEYIIVTNPDPPLPFGQQGNGHEGTAVILPFKQEPCRTASPLDQQSRRIAKRIFDLLVSAAAVMLILPWLIPLIAILIRLDSKGPVFFLQKRNGRKGRLFTCIKFRSMKVNAQADITPATPGDKRITRVGGFLRKHHIDELPQFFNVLLGEMSVIGPRPHMIRDNVEYGRLISAYSLRHQIKPGITGLAQVMGYTGEILCLQKMQKRVEADLFYIRHWSFAMDVRVLFSTLRFYLPGRISPSKPRETDQPSSLHHAVPPNPLHIGGTA